MRVRCTNDGSTFDVPDDMLGMKVECPQCGHLLRVATESEQVQANPPAPKPSVPANLENQIYDGLPPLSVMMALRRGKGPSYDHEELRRRYPMTEDDWKALAAFESVLVAVGAAWISSVLCIIAILANMTTLFLAFRGHASDQKILDLYLIGVGGSMLLFMVCQAIQSLGATDLARIRPTWKVSWVFFTSVGSILILSLDAAAHLAYALWDPSAAGTGLAALLAVTINVVAAGDLIKTSFRFWQALSQIQPPEITSRLVEALKYLD